MSATAKSVGLLAKARIQDSHHRLYEPTKKKKPIYLDSHCVFRILENCIRKIGMELTLDAVLRSGNLSSVVDKTLSGALQEHQMLTERLEMQECQEQESGGGQKGGGKGTSMRAMAQLEEGVKNTLRDLLRIVRDHPETIFGLSADLGLEIDESKCLLIDELKKLRSHALEELQNSVDEEPELPHDATSCSLNKLVSQEEEVTEDMIKVDEQISDKSHQIKTLQKSLQEKKNKEAALQRILDKLGQQTKISNVKETSAEPKIDGLNIELNKLIVENTQVVEELQRKNERVRLENEKLLQNYDDKIKGIQGKLKWNEIECKRVDDELRNLQKGFSVLEMECNQIQERRRLAEEKRKDEMRELELKTKAAILIQAWWRRCLSKRCEVQGQKKDKKAKKGKGKGKGKGKKAK